MVDESEDWKNKIDYEDFRGKSFERSVLACAGAIA
jgi:hypothetical protein